MCLSVTFDPPPSCDTGRSTWVPSSLSHCEDKHHLTQSSFRMYHCCEGTNVTVPYTSITITQHKSYIPHVSCTARWCSGYLHFFTSFRLCVRRLSVRLRFGHWIRCLCPETQQVWAVCWGCSGMCSLSSVSTCSFGFLLWTLLSYRELTFVPSDNCNLIQLGQNDTYGR